MSEVVLKLKKLHPAQEEIFATKKRFNVLKCGRRFGKTEIAIDLIANTILDGHPIGYWNPTYKDLYEVWTAIKSICYPIIKEKNEQVKQITTITGGKVDFWSMDEPDSGRGRAYKVVIVDEAEKAPKFKEAWQQTIRQTLTDFKGDAWIMSTPKFGKTFFKELVKYKDKYPDWMSWVKTSYENPYLDPAELELMRKIDPLTFKCEMMAEDVDLVDKPFFWSFDPQKHINDNIKLNIRDVVYLSFDFNVDPITCIIAQGGANFIHILDEVRLTNSNLYELCNVIKTKYNGCLFQITGDASGMARHVSNKGNINNYTIILQELGASERQLIVPRSNPPVSESRTLCNSLFSTHENIYIHSRCQYLIDDLKFLQVKDDGSIDKKSDAHKSHLADCLRYLFNSLKADYILRKF